MRLPSANSPYWIQSPLEIRQQLRGLLRKGERVLLWFGPEQSIVSNVLDVNDRGDLLLDVGPDDKVNRKLLDVSTVTLCGFLDGVELQGEVGPLRMASHEGLPAFSCAPPKRLHRLQRREFHRVTIPVGQRTRCLLPGAEGSSKVNATLLDLSLGGLRLVDPMVPGVSLAVGQVLPACKLELDEEDHFLVDLEVRHRSSVTSRSGHVTHKVGCRFGRLPMGAEQMLQRFIIQIERDRRALQSED